MADNERARLWALAGVLLLLGTTGALWLRLHFARGDDLPGPAEAWCLKLHGGLALISLVLVGAVFDGHVVKGLKGTANRSPGILLFGALVLLGVTGYGLYYFDGDALRSVTAWTHRIVGALSLPLLGWHAFGSLRLRRAVPPGRPGWGAPPPGGR
jgi:hypothetical protein